MSSALLGQICQECVGSAPQLVQFWQVAWNFLVMVGSGVLAQMSKTVRFCTETGAWVVFTDVGFASVLDLQGKWLLVPLHSLDSRLCSPGDPRYLAVFAVASTGSPIWLQDASSSGSSFALILLCREKRYSPLCCHLWGVRFVLQTGLPVMGALSLQEFF